MPLLQAINRRGRSAIGGDAPLAASDLQEQGRRGLSFINNRGIRRPFLDKNDRPAILLNTLQKDGTPAYTVEKGVRRPIQRQVSVYDAIYKHGIIDPVLFAANATSLRKEEWQKLDERVMLAYRQPLVAFADLMAASSVSIDGMSTMTYEYEAMSDPGAVVVDMDGTLDDTSDTANFLLRSLPLPVAHIGFRWSQRLLNVSGNKGQPLDTTMAEAGARRIAEHDEDQYLGLTTGLTYRTISTGPTAHDLTSRVFGLANYTNRNTKTNFTAGSGGGWAGATLYNEVLAALETLRGDGIYGPFVLYHSSDWDQYMNQIFSTAGADTLAITVRDQLRKIDRIADVRLVPRLSSTFTIFLVQLTPDVVQGVNGMPVTTMQWPGKGGLEIQMKILSISAPLFKSDYNGNCGYLHGTTT